MPKEMEVRKPRTGFLFTFFYIFIIQSVPSAIISGGIEFAIAYGMYHSVSGKITLWRFPHTLSGDCALTVFIQVCVTVVLEELFVGLEDYNGRCGKIPCPWVPKNKWVRLYFDVDRGMRRMYAEYLDYEDTTTDEEKRRMVEENPDTSRTTEESEDAARKEEDEDEDNSSRDGLNTKNGFKPMTTKEYLRKLIIHYDNHGVFWNFVEWLIQKVARGLIMAALIWFFVWPVCMGILAGIGHKFKDHDYYFNHYPLPQVMKLIYAVAIAFACTPMSIIAVMLRNDWYEIQYQESLKNQNDLESIDQSSQEDIEIDG